jgi:hypothetical protein
MKEMLKTRYKLIILLTFLAVLLILSIIGYAILKTRAASFLSSPIELGETLITPQSFQNDSIFKFNWESIKVAASGLDLFFGKPKISIYPMLGNRRELLSIYIDSVHVSVKPEKSKDSAKTAILKHISHPDLWLPFRVSVKVRKVAVDVEEVGKWGLDSLAAAKSGRQKKFYIRASNINGNHLAGNLFLRAEYMWNELFSDAMISISDRVKDSVSVTINAPRLKLEDLSADVFANVENLPFWLGDKWPEAAPDIGKITLRSNISANVLTPKASFDLSLQARIGEFWQLPQFNASIKASGNNKGIYKSEISLNGKNEESIDFKGNLNWDLDGSGELGIKGINLTLGPETLPADATFHGITKKGNLVSASFTTGAGSDFNARIADINEPVITFSADIAPEEPWAVQWTGDMVKLASPTILTGSFSFKETMLKANLKTGIPFAYYAAADELNVSLWMDSKGIHFPKGTIRHKGHESDFDGEVIWDKEYFAFKLRQEDKGTADIYGTFIPKISLGLQNLNTLLLPFADSAMLKGYNGIVSGNWVHDLKKRTGEASVSVSTVIQDLSINASSEVKMHGDSLFVRKIELEQDGKILNGFIFALLPTETRENFDIQRAGIKIPNMNLVSLLATFDDSTLSSGFANGGLRFDKIEGLQGEVLFSKIAIRGLDSNVVKFPNISLRAEGDSAKISSKIFLTENLWNGNLEAIVNKPDRGRNIPVKISYNANNIGNVGNLNFDGLLSKDFKKAFGSMQITGDWFLPNGIGEIKNANVNIYASTALGKNALDSLSVNFKARENIFEKDIIKIPFDLTGHIRNGMLRVDSAFVYGQGNEKINAKLQFDLASLKLKDFSFKTDIFTLFLLDEHWIKIRNVTGRTELDREGITILADLPSITYRMESSEYGTAHVAVHGEVSYRFPFQTEQSQTNASLKGHFDVSNITYKKNFEVVPDFWHWDKAFKQVSKFMSSALREKGMSSAEKYALTGRPTALNVRIRTTGTETASVSSNLLEFPFAVNLFLLGTTRNMLISGDINSVDNGKVGYDGLTMFDLSFFRVYWRDMPLRHGEIEMHASNDYPFCSPEAGEDDCTISLNVTGTFSKFNMQPSASCNVEASPALIYYSMLLGCISENYESGNVLDRNKLAGKILGSFISSTANKGLGKNVVGDIELKWAFFEDVPQELDTSYVRIPFSLSNIVPNLEMVVGYTEDRSIDPRYDHSIEAGLRYMLPVFDSTDINRNFLDPSLDVNANLIRRSYQSKTESGQDEARLEQNVGLVYKHRFWDPCIFGIGWCSKESNNLK